MPVRTLRRFDNDRESPADEVVRNLVDLARAARVEAGSLPRRDERGIERILDAGLERGIHVGEPQDLRRHGPRRVTGGVEPHRALGQRAGLVGAQHAHAAEILDRVQAAHDDTALRHRMRAAGQRHADDRRQKLRG
jgi:hypothetical protein